MLPRNMLQPRKTVVLLGAGHAHLFSIQRAAAFRRRGIEMTLIAPGPFWYSGLATGVLGGVYPPEQDQIDVARLVEAGGGRFVTGRAVRIDPARRRVILEGGGEVAYDALSVNVGSEPSDLPGSDNAANVYPLKPLGQLWRLRRDLEAAGAARRRVVIVGGGASGGEIAMNVRSLLGRLGARESSVLLLAGSSRLFEQFAPGVAGKAARLLGARGVEVLLDTRVARVENGAAVMPEGERVPFDFLVNATGLKPPALFRHSGLATDEEGALLLNRHLQAVGDPFVFGGGDCVAFGPAPLAKIGVYAVREAPVLFHNLLAFLSREPGRLRVFKPQRSFLLILNLGDGEGLAVWRRFSWHGRAAFRWKDFLDRRFLAASRRAFGT